MLAPSRSQPGKASKVGFKTNPSFKLTDSQWFRIARFFPNQPMTRRGGRPERDNRACFEGILFVLVSGIRWKDLPKEFPAYATCWRRFKKWVEDGSFARAWHELLKIKDDLGELDLETVIGDGTFIPAKLATLVYQGKTWVAA